MTCLYDPLSPEQLRDPYPAWAAHPAVFYDERLGMWSVTGYDEVLAVLRDTATFSSADAFALRGFPRPRMLVAKDPPEHTRLRKLMQRAFTPPCPREFDLDRPKGEHLAFGRWTHFCLGAPLARLEARVALNVLLDRVPGLRAVPDQALEYAPTLTTQTLRNFLVEVR